MKHEANTIFEVMCETNDNLIKAKKPIKTTVVFLKDGEAPNLHELVLTKNNRAEMQDRVRTIVQTEKTDAYIVFSCATAIIENKKTKDKSNNNCVVRTLYTPKEKVSEIVWYKDGVILGKERVNGRQIIMDQWDAWMPKILVTVKTDIHKQKEAVAKFKYKSKK